METIDDCTTLFILWTLVASVTFAVLRLYLPLHQRPGPVLIRENFNSSSKFPALLYYVQWCWLMTSDDLWAYIYICVCVCVCVCVCNCLYKKSHRKIFADMWNMKNCKNLEEFSHLFFFLKDLSEILEKWFSTTHLEQVFGNLQMNLTAYMIYYLSIYLG